MWLRGLISVRSIFNLTEATARRCAWGWCWRDHMRCVRTGSRMFGAGACRALLVLEAGGQRDDPLLLFVRSQECEASLVRSGDVRDVVAMTIAPTSRKKSLHLVHTQSLCL